MARDVICALTSIPPRLDGIGPTLHSLAGQDGPDAVHLVLPHGYDSFPGPVIPPPLPPGVTLTRCSVDHGPATKALPMARALRGSGARLLICDDDWIYAPGWAAALLSAARDHPDDAIAASGFEVARLGLTGPGTIAQGFSGLLFDPDWLPDAAWHLPDRFKPVDDIWLSGMLAHAGRRIHIAGTARPLCRPGRSEAAPLQRRTDRAGLNRACAGHLARSFGVWGGP